MDIRPAFLILVVGLLAGSCSEKSAPEPVTELAASETPGDTANAPGTKKTGNEDKLPPPSESRIGKDCAAFVRSTKVVRAPGAGNDCPECPAGGTEVLTFRYLKTEKVSCSGDTCKVLVTLHAVFNPGTGETIAGGLTAWISPEQRSEYLSGRTPSDEQVYRVQITYKRRGDIWRAVEFDRAPAE